MAYFVSTASRCLYEWSIFHYFDLVVRELRALFGPTGWHFIKAAIFVLYSFLAFIQVCMHYNNVCIESFGYTLPDQIVTSEEIERRLEPLYRRLRLPEGRLELMTGIRQRRFWSQDSLPSDHSIRSARHALAAADIDRDAVGALIHGSVCRDYLEPATACRVHHALGLSQDCMIYDVSNACLGMINGMLQAANMIELGQIRAALVVGTENGRPLVETTIASLNASQTLTRQQVKYAVASLTIGSGSCAVLLTDRELSQTGNRLLAAGVRANTDHHQLCQSDRDEAIGTGMQPLMQTDSEQLMQQGIATGVATFGRFLANARWEPEDIDKTFCHQVGSAHRKLMLNSLGISTGIDFATFPWLGNTGSVALPITMAIGLECGHVQRDENIALLGIGSGINSLMLAVNWQRSIVSGSGHYERQVLKPEPHVAMATL